eukprot:TRINITY_DN270_c0_g1_i5.p1 TRINITY_DN270_c0_g1~~TRINITY_DN270_c0_g1_i5.p1  ORF type:complete len:332 (+),score=88.59 TRINITY_DN270_c0_g1_i5:73-996(+)
MDAQNKKIEISLDESNLTPDDLTFQDQLFDLDFHPLVNLIAVGSVVGQVDVFRYSGNENQLLSSLTHHSDSCRAVTFSPDGNHLFTASSDQSIGMVDVHTGTVVAHLQDAHEAAVNKLFCYDDFLVSGDDDGCIKIWDLKKKTCTQTFEDNEDFISAFTISEDRKFLLATSGDGTLAVYNLRKGKLHIRSQNLEDELLSILIVKDGRKVVCGSQGGILNLFNWGEFGDFSDRFPGHPFSIDTMVKIDEDTIATGSSDGLIRVVGILPNKMLGVIGDHEDFPVEKLSVSYDKRFMLYHALLQQGGDLQ